MSELVETETVGEIKSVLDQANMPEQSNEQELKEDIPQLSYKERQEQAYNKEDEAGKKAWMEGWRPQELDKGKNRDGSDRKWLTAEEFLNKSRTNPAIANERIRELSKRIEKAEKDAKMAYDRIEAAEEKGYSKALEEIAKKQREAVEVGDVEVFDNLRKQEADIIANKYKPEPIVEDVLDNEPVNNQKQLSSKDVKTLRDWEANNQWMSTDAKIANYAINYEKELLQNSPYMSLEERLVEVEKEVKETFTKKFSTQSSGQIFGSSESGGYGASKSVKGYSDLSKHTQSNCDQVMEMRGINLRGEKAIKDFRQSFARAHFSSN